MADAPQTRRNRLLVPLTVVSLVCLAEALGIAFLLGRAPAPAPVGYAPPPPNWQNPASVAPAPAAAVPFAFGKVGERVESAGLAITVIKLSNTPQHGELFKPSAGQKFVDVDLLIENNTGRRFDYYSTEFSLKDDQARSFSSGALGAGDPALGWGHIVPGEKVRGHVAFTVSQDAKGLALACPTPANAPANTPPIRIHLDQ